MSLQGFEKIATNCDILLHIFKALTFEDQLRFANVNDLLGNVFQSFVWKENYRTLAIYGNDDHFVVTNEKETNRKLLTPQGFQEFKCLYADNVSELKVYRKPLPDIRQFENITSLRYTSDEEFQRESFQLVANNFPNLECLYIHGYFNGRQEYGNNINLDYLLRVKNLKQLCVEHSSVVSCITYRDFRSIVNELPLEYLKLRFPLEPAEEDATQVTSSVALNSAGLKELVTTFNPQKWSSTYLSSFWGIFENLLILSVKLTDKVTDESLKTLANACKNLEQLKIRYTNFSKIETFSIPRKLTELSLYICSGLTMNNLKQLLTKYEIRSFASKKTYYAGPFEDFRLSPLIRKLLLDKLDICKHKSFYDGNENLKELLWQHPRECLYCCRNVPLVSCLNLESFNVVGQLIELESLLQLQHLRKLVIRFSRDVMQWSYITALLAHKPLRELHLHIYPYMPYMNMAEDAPLEGFPSNVSILKVHVRIFELAIDFWLDLFKHNTNMELIVFAFHWRDIKLLLKLVHHRSFPSNLKTIDVFGFTVNCHDLRRNFDMATENVEPFYNLYTVNIHRIILRRK